MRLLSKYVLLALTIIISCSTAWASVKSSAASLNDLPKKWEGVAGDLFNKTQASLVMEEITLLENGQKDGTLFSRYRVKSILKVGSRKLNIHEIHLSSSKIDIYELSLLSQDKLVPNLFVIVKRDEETGKFSLKEMPRKGWERRFVLEESN